jgi:cytochrome c oxidase cbb3-type subunit 1
VLTWVVGGTVGWCVAATLGLIASIKFHGPGFLADNPWLTYGRVRVAATQVGWWGAVLPVVFGVLLGWLGRLARNGMAYPWLAFLGAALWHLGSLVALLGILSGATTGYEAWGLPRQAVWVYAGGFVLYLVSFLATWHDRRERSLEPAHWYVLSGVLWMGWSAATAFVLLDLKPVRGVTQAVVDGWFGANAWLLAGTLMGLGLMHGWWPLIAGRPVYSRNLAILTFAGLLLFGGWTGIAPSAPVPAWLPVTSTVATILCVVPWVAEWLNWRGTMAGCRARLREAPAGWFLWWARAGFLAAAAAKLALHVPGLDRVLEQTWWDPARQWAQVHGFLGLAGVAGFYAWVREERLPGGWAGWVRWHGYCMVTGGLLLVLSLAAAGLVQGLAWRDTALSNVAVLQRTLMWLRLSTVGELLWWLGVVLFGWSLIGMTVRWWVGCWRSWWMRVTRPVALQEATE